MEMEDQERKSASGAPSCRFYHFCNPTGTCKRGYTRENCPEKTPFPKGQNLYDWNHDLLKNQVSIYIRLTGIADSRLI